MIRSTALAALSLCLAAPFAALAQPAVAEARRMGLAGDVAGAVELAERERARLPDDAPELLEVLSWAARAGVAAEDWDVAGRFGERVHAGATELAAKKGVDSSPSLATALGAAIEVLGKVMVAAGDRAEAIAFLHAEREKYRGTSIETRIQKNYLAISLEGKPMPPVAAERYLGGTKPADTAGKVALFYFWAHWCSDCKAQKPALAALHERYASRGLVIVGPTHLYGYTAAGRDATPAEEIAYIEGPWQQANPLPDWLSRPLAQENFANFGVSTTPTLVLVDRSGIVRLYHPGKMTLEELEAAIAPLL